MTTKDKALNDPKTLVRSGLRLLTRVGIIRRQLRKLTMAGYIPKQIWYRLPVETTFEVDLYGKCTFCYSSIAEDQIGRLMYWRGTKSWEHETLEVFTNLARESNMILDIGANTGVYSLIACSANTHARVIAFEPVPFIYQRLTNHLKLNNFEHRCEARNYAVSNMNGLAKLHVPSGVLPTSASLNPQGFRGYAGELIDVPVTTIDTLFGQTEQVDLMKIDVEGFEDKVLDGMRLTLARCAPSIVVECNHDGPFREVESILKGFGYRFYALRGGAPALVDKIVPDPTREFRNYLCVARDMQPSL